MCDIDRRRKIKKDDEKKKTFKKIKIINIGIETMHALKKIENFVTVSCVVKIFYFYVVKEIEKETKATEFEKTI